ncbi:MAG: hemerythrin domain-containing protein [Bacteroidetes bacterium]|nr:hemerythrin domain-containing protein [Bacteroidota bacterium]
MNTAAEILLDEHKTLFDAIEATKKVQKVKDVELYRKLIINFISFFKDFTEIYHHPKEEKILYKKILKHSKNIDNKILNEISGNHHELDEQIILVEQYYNENENENNKLKKAVDKYINLLFKHIWKENIILIKNLSYLLDEKELKSVAKSFIKLDEKYEKKKKLQNDITKLIKKISSK